MIRITENFTKRLFELIIKHLKTLDKDEIIAEHKCFYCDNVTYFTIEDLAEEIVDDGTGIKFKDMEYSCSKCKHYHANYIVHDAYLIKRG